MKRLLKQSISVELSIAMVATQVEFSAVNVKADVNQHEEKLQGDG